MVDFRHTFPVLALIPDEKTVADIIPLGAASKLREILARPPKQVSDVTGSARKFLESATISCADNTLTLVLAKEKFATLDSITSLLPYTTATYIENLDRLLLRNLRTPEANKKPIEKVKIKEATRGVKIPLAALKDTILSWATEGILEPKALKLSVARALFEENLGGDIPVKTNNISLNITSEGGWIVITADFFNGAKDEILCGMPKKTLVALDGKLTNIAYP